MSDPRGGPPGRDAARRQAEGIRQILLNATSLLLAYGLPRLFTVGAVLLAARVLGAASFGAYGTAAALAVILSIVATAGMVPLLVRDIAREPERTGELVAAAHRVKAATSAMMLILLYGIARWLLSYPDEVVVAAMLLGVAYAIEAFGDNLSAYFQAVERMHVWMQASAAYGLVTGALGAVLVWLSGSVVWFCAAPVVGRLVALAVLQARAPAHVRRPGRPRPGSARALIRALAPFAAAFVVLTVYYKVDVILLSRWRTPADVGVFTAAYKAVDVFQALVLVGVAAVYPRLSRSAPRGGEPAGRWAGTRVTELVLLATVPLAGLVWLARAPLVGVLYGSAYAAAVPVLGILAAVLPALALNILAGYVLGAAERMGSIAAGYSAALALNVTLNALLIPTLGPVGAALSMLGSEALLALGLLALLHVHARAHPGWRSLVMIALVAAACPLWTLLPGPDHALPTVLAFVATVLVIYGSGRAVPPAEWRGLRTALRPLPAVGAGHGPAGEVPP